VLLTASSALYFVLDPAENRFPAWLAIYTLQFALYFLLARSILRHGPIRVSHLLACAVFARIVLWFTHPVFEADYYRYLWDGHVFSHGVNPYLHPPEAPELDPLETDYRFFIQWSRIRTIYPPVAQYAFRIAHFVAPDSLLGLKIVLTFFDFGTGLLLLLWQSRRGVDPSWSALYFLNPLVLKEVANSAHVDAVAVFFATSSIWVSSAPQGGRAVSAFVLLALSAGAKAYSVVLAPLVARTEERWISGAAAALLTMALLYAPFLDAGTGVFDGTLAFGRHWLFNASLFRILDGLGAPRATAAVLLATFVGFLAARLRSKVNLPAACLSALGALLLLSPVVNAWYVLWLLPFACLERNLPWLAFTYLVGFSYSWFQHREAAPYFQLAEYGALLALLLLPRARVSVIRCREAGV
jgi:hypothetical protein